MLDLRVFGAMRSALIVIEKLFPCVFRFADENNIRLAPAAFAIQARNRPA